MKIKFAVFFLSSPWLWAALPQSIPRQASEKFISQGTFNGGGSALAANLAGIRFSPHGKEGYERWVIDFSDVSHSSVGSVAPSFQVRYVPAEKVPVPNGTDIIVAPPKFVVTLRGIHRNLVKKTLLNPLLKRSHHVGSIILYPPIEEGDMAMELVLKDSVLFNLHQPLKNEGRLVLDLKNAPLGQ